MLTTGTICVSEPPLGAVVPALALPTEVGLVSGQPNAYLP